MKKLDSIAAAAVENRDNEEALMNSPVGYPLALLSVLVSACKAMRS